MLACLARILHCLRLKSISHGIICGILVFFSICIHDLSNPSRIPELFHFMKNTADEKNNKRKNNERREEKSECD